MKKRSTTSKLTLHKETIMQLDNLLTKSLYSGSYMYTDPSEVPTTSRRASFDIACETGTCKPKTTDTGRENV